MNKIITCIDGSTYANSVCNLSAWAAQRLECDITLLHVASPHSNVAHANDLSGTIGIDAHNLLLNKLTEIDEAHGKLEQQKGQLILQHAQEVLGKKGYASAETLHQRGAFSSIIKELEDQAELIVMGIRGEDAETTPEHLGSNLDRVARTIHKPLLLATKNAPKIERFLIAYDGGENANKAVDYAINNSLLKGIECHLLQVGKENEANKNSLNDVTEKLKNAGFSVHSTLQDNAPVQEAISSYIKAHEINLLVMGAYSHSKLHSLILGSTTAKLLHKAAIPVLLFR